MGEEEYFFDSVRKATESQKKTKKLKEGNASVGRLRSLHASACLCV